MGKKHQNKSQIKELGQSQPKEKPHQLGKKTTNKLSPQKRNEISQLVDKLLKGKLLNCLLLKDKLRA